MYDLMTIEEIKQYTDDFILYNIELTTFYYKYENNTLTKKDITYRNTQIKKIIHLMKYNDINRLELIKYGYNHIV